MIGAAGGDGKAAAAAAAARSRPKDAFEEEMQLLAQRQQEEQEVRPTRLAPNLLSFMTCVCLYVCLSGCVVLCCVVLCCGWDCQRKKVMSAQAQRNEKMARQAYQVLPLSPLFCFYSSLTCTV